jgi:hypothetical protein
MHVAAVFDEDAFAVTKGEPRTYQHVSDGSGKRIHIHFCATCGTKLFLRLERFPGGVGVYSGTLDDPNGFCKMTDISRHIFLASGRQGMIVPAGAEVCLKHAVSADGEWIEPDLLDAPFVIGEQMPPSATQDAEP